MLILKAPMPLPHKLTRSTPSSRPQPPPTVSSSLGPRPATKPKHANPTNNHDVPSSSERAASEGERKQKSAKNQGLYISRNCELCGTRSGPAAQDSRLIARYSHIRSLALLSLACCCSRCSACWALLLCPSSIATLVLLCARASNRPLAIETRCAVIWL